MNRAFQRWNVNCIQFWARETGAKYMPHTGKLTSCQARAARAMLTWSISHLARKSKISESTIRRIESGFEVPEGVTLDMLEKLQRYFEGRGFVFTWDDQAGLGLHWSKSPSRRSSDRRRHGSPPPLGTGSN